MRLLERTLVQLEIAPRIRKIGELGGRAEAFSKVRSAVRGSVLPEGGETETCERGMVARDRLRILVSADVVVSAGDAVVMQETYYRVLRVDRWAAHRELICEAISC